MNSADCIASLHRAMCSTFNADCLTETPTVETLLKHDVDDVKVKIKQDDKDYAITAQCAEKQEAKKPIKSDEQASVPAMELLLSTMSSIFDAECATSTAEGGTLLNHDLAEDKTIKWRNLVNNKFAYKENITYKRGRRVKKQANSMQRSLSYANSNGKAVDSNKKHTKPEQRSTRSESKRDELNKSLDKRSANAQHTITDQSEATTPTAECMEKDIKYLLSDEEDLQQLNEGKQNDAYKSHLTVCKEELIVGDDEILLLAADTNALSACSKRRSKNNENSTGLLDTKRKCAPVDDGAEEKLVTSATSDMVPIKVETIEKGSDSDEDLTCLVNEAGMTEQENVKRRYANHVAVKHKRKKKIRSYRP